MRCPDCELPQFSELSQFSGNFDFMASAKAFLASVYGRLLPTELFVDTPFHIGCKSFGEVDARPFRRLTH